MRCRLRRERKRHVLPPMKLRLGLVGVAGIAAGKCKKCSVDCFVVVEPTHAAIARTAINKLKLRTRDERRVRLFLRSAVGDHAAGTALPAEGDLGAYLQNDAVVSVGVSEAHALSPPAAPDASTDPLLPPPAPPPALDSLAALEREREARERPYGPEL